jgi:glycosyltransferase involved in cell wall biosynthesis
MKKISVVVPVFNEEDNVAPLFNEVKKVCAKNRYKVEIIFIDDGSNDNTVQAIKKLKPVKLIQFRKNFGQTAAMDAGIKSAKYDYIIVMDGDGQNDPADIPALIRHLEKNNLDIVSGWRKNRKDSFLKKFVSRGANILRKLIINDNIHDSGCSLKIYRKKCFENLTLFGEMHRFVPALLKIRGFKIGEVVVNHRPRIAGKTKYNWSRTIKGFIDMISVWFWNKYAVRPLHLLGGFGILSLFLGFMSAIWTVVLYFRGEDLSNNFQPMLMIFFGITGLQLFISGLIADVLIKIYYQKQDNTSYNIKQIYESK